MYTIPPTLFIFTPPYLIPSPGSHLCPTIQALLSHYTFGLQRSDIVYVCIPYHLHIPPSHSFLLTPLQVLTCGHGQGTTLLLSHYTFGLQWGIIAYVCIPYHLHIPPSYSLSRFSPVAMINVLHHISHHTTVITLHVWVAMGYHCICLYTIPPTHSTFTLSLQVLTCGHDQCTTSHITPHYCYHTTRLCYNEVSLYMSVYHTTYTFHLHTPSPDSHLWPWSMYYITYHTTLLLSHYTFSLQWGIIVYVCIPYHLHIPPAHSLLSPLQILTCGHGQRTTSHHTTVITLHVCVTMGYHCIYLYTIPPTHSTFTLPPLISSPDSHLWPRSTYYIPPHHCYYTTRLCYNGVSLYMSVYHTTYTFHLHTPSSYLLSRLSPVATVNILHHISHHTTVTTLYVGLHCVCLHTIPPTLPPLISSPGSHLWPRSTYYITYHTTPLLPHYTLGYIVYVCILYLLHSLLLSPLQALTCGHGQHTTSHITPHHCYHIIRWVTLCMSVYYTSYTPSSYLLSRLSPVATVNILHHISHHTTVTTLYVGLHCVCLYTIPPTLPPLISSPGSHLWPRSTYYITYHTTPLLSHYTFGLHCIYLYTIPSTHSTFTLPPLISSPGSHLWPRSMHYITYHTTVISLHVWVTMRYHCICLYSVPPSHSTFTLPPLISSPGSHLWPW